MAKKKNKTSRKKTSPTRAAKKSPKKKASRKKPAAKAAAKAGPKPAAKAGPKAGPPGRSRVKTAARNSTGGGSTSVDGLLKKFQKQRSTQVAQLEKLRKKIEELEAKTRLFREQIAQLTEKEDAAKQSIANIDSRRDEEVTTLLAKLGVQLRSPGIGSKTNSSVISELATAEDSNKRADANRPTTLKLG